MQTKSQPADSAGIAVALFLLALAGVIFFDMSRLQLSSTYGLGPKAMPIVVAAGLAVLGLANLITAWRGGLPAREKFDPMAVQRILGGLVALIAIIGFGGGFIAATALLFAMTAAAFGRSRFLIDLAIGIVLAVAIFLVFDKLLTLSLPAGPIERLL